MRQRLAGNKIGFQARTAAEGSINEVYRFIPLFIEVSPEAGRNFIREKYAKVQMCNSAKVMLKNHAAG